MPSLRDDFERLKAQVSRMGGSGLQATTFLAMTASDGDYPTAANRFYKVRPLTVAGDEEEGVPASLTVDSSADVFAYNIGGGVPPVGANVVVFSVRNRLVFTYG